MALEDGPAGWTNSMPIAIHRAGTPVYNLTQLNVCLSPNAIKIDMNLPPRLAEGAGLVCGNLVENPYRFVTPVETGWLGIVRKDGTKLNFTLRKFKRESGRHEHIEEYNLSGSCSPSLATTRSQKK